MRSAYPEEYSPHNEILENVSPEDPSFPEPFRSADDIIRRPSIAKPPGIERPPKSMYEVEPSVPEQVSHAKKTGLFFMTYYRVPVNSALVISGPWGTRIVTGRSTFVYPTEIVKELSLEIMSVNVIEEHILTNDAIPVDIDAEVQFGVSHEPELIKVAAKSFLDRPLRDVANMVRKILEGHLRAICADMTTIDIYYNREQLQRNVADASEPDFEKLGLTIKVFVIKDIGDPTGYFANVGVTEIVKKWKEAISAAADARKEAQMKVADAHQEAEKRKAEAKLFVAEAWKNANVKMAEFDKEIGIARADAEMSGPIKAEKKRVELAEQKKLVREKEGQAEKLYKIETAKGDAESKRMVGVAAADAQKAMAQAYSDLDESSMAINAMNILPSIVREASGPISNIKDLRILQTGSNAGGGVASPFVDTIQQMIVSVVPLLEMYGVDLRGVSKKGKVDGDTIAKVSQVWAGLDSATQQQIASELIKKLDTDTLQELLKKTKG